MPKYNQDKRNANRGTERGRELLKQSLSRLGPGRSILVDKHGTAIAGNKTLAEATSQGIPTVEVETDGKTLVVVKRTDLDLDTDIKARELAFADNRVAELDLDWDTEVLKTDLELLQSDFLDELWTPDDLGDLFSSSGEHPQESEEIPDEFKQYSEEILCDYRCPKCHYEWNGKPK